MKKSQNQSIGVAVIGKSASGKSAFIRSFSKYPEKINSVGKGQTTRSYSEYNFLVTDTDQPISVNIALMSERNFVQRRTAQVIEKLYAYMEPGLGRPLLTLDWMKEQIAEYLDDVKEVVIHSSDFFDIREFSFLSPLLTSTLDQLFVEACQIIVTLNDEDSKEDIHLLDIKRINEIKRRLKTSNAADDGDKTQSDAISTNKEREEEAIEMVWSQYFTTAYKYIMETIRSVYRGSAEIQNDIEDTTFSFDLADGSKTEFLELCLKVSQVENSTEKRSLSSIVNKTRITSVISKQYFEKLHSLNFKTILLVDTFGLDHAQAIDDRVLRERYHRIFNDDYPKLSVAFFVEPIRAGAANDFLKEIEVLYSQKPNIMTYIIASYVDEQNEETIIHNKDWLLLKEKNNDYPNFDGRVLETVFDSNRIANTLKRSGVPETLAYKRLEVMRKRFGLFCGNIQEISEHKHHVMTLMNEMNIVSITSVMTSIIDKEHLGNGYININALQENLKNKEQIIPFAKIMIAKATERFKELFSDVGPRTKGKLRQNLGSKILGFNGSTADVTWYRVFSDAYNHTFTKRVNIDGKSTMLSEVFRLEGNEKIAFDELMTGFYKYLYNVKYMGDVLPLWQHEINWIDYATETEQKDCMWGILLKCIPEDEFTAADRYPRVVDWLIHMHDFKMKCNENFYEDWSEIFSNRMNKALIDQCRNHNIKVAANKAKRSQSSYLQEKETLYLDYKHNYDSRMEKPEFYRLINET
ncbi:hypothetical protein [Paenibacillus nasutitermitis]|uniref:Uncharacterized protein n=1 Tax=Paenibacillus nasutitermitis TaxID=1652958 RepID=A0A917E3G9_9BACL|nr:hypothetical protein [Paenibacillus nasutitermitis]GGE00058.1 hypothetical protein GCM10010911_68770 [Paenibacillus nasutitermitis]